jgi:hypothetical protein
MKRTNFCKECHPANFVWRTASGRPTGDFWSVTVAIAGTAPAKPGSALGRPGRYLTATTITHPNPDTLDWMIDPFAREFGAGKLSAFTLGYTPYVIWLVVAGSADVVPDLLLTRLVGRSREGHQLFERPAIFGIDVVQLRRH